MISILASLSRFVGVQRLDMENLLGFSSAIVGVLIAGKFIDMITELVKHVSLRGNSSRVAPREHRT